MTENTLPEWETVYKALTKAEREEITLSAILKIEARRRATLAVLMADPRHLAGLPVSQLREVANVGMEDAHAWLLENAPTAADVVVALECLTAFTITKDEPTAADLADVVTSLEDVWKVAGGKYAEDLAAFEAFALAPTSAVGQSARMESRPARAGRRLDTKADKKRPTVSTETKASKA